MGKQSATLLSALLLATVLLVASASAAPAADDPPRPPYQGSQTAPGEGPLPPASAEEDLERLAAELQWRGAVEDFAGELSGWKVEWAQERGFLLPWELADLEAGLTNWLRDLAERESQASEAGQAEAAAELGKLRAEAAALVAEVTEALDEWPPETRPSHDLLRLDPDDGVNAISEYLERAAREAGTDEPEDPDSHDGRGQQNPAVAAPHLPTSGDPPAPDVGRLRGNCVRGRLAGPTGPGGLVSLSSVGCLPPALSGPSGLPDAADPWCATGRATWGSAGSVVARTSQSCGSQTVEGGRGPVNGCSPLPDVSARAATRLYSSWCPQPSGGEPKPLGSPVECLPGLPVRLGGPVVPSSVPCERVTALNASLDAGTLVFSDAAVPAVAGTYLSDAAPALPAGGSPAQPEDDGQARDNPAREPTQVRDRTEREQLQPADNERAEAEQSELVAASEQIVPDPLDNARQPEEGDGNLPSPPAAPPAPPAIEPASLPARTAEPDDTEHVDDDSDGAFGETEVSEPADDVLDAQPPDPAPGEPAEELAEARAAAEIPAVLDGTAQLVSCADWQDGMEGACDSNQPASAPIEQVTSRSEAETTDESVV